MKQRECFSKKNNKENQQNIYKNKNSIGNIIIMGDNSINENINMIKDKLTDDEKIEENEKNKVVYEIDNKDLDRYKEENEKYKKEYQNIKIDLDELKKENENLQNIYNDIYNELRNKEKIWSKKIRKQ